MAQGVGHTATGQVRKIQGVGLNGNDLEGFTILTLASTTTHLISSHHLNKRVHETGTSGSAKTDASLVNTT